VGIETGQLGVLCVGMPFLILLRRLFSPRSVVVALSALGGLLGGVWLVERWQILRQLDATCSGAFCMNRAMPWLVLLVGVLGLVSVTISLHLKRRPRHLPPPEAGIR
jgi:hypothetical protein